MIYVVGGGGVDQLAAADYFVIQVGNDILEDRDFSLYNQRGAYRNEPSLVCPDLADFFWELDALNLRSHDKADRRIEKRLECYDNLLAQGIDLAHTTPSRRLPT